MAYESKASFKPAIPNDPPNRSYKVDVNDGGTTIISQQEVVDGKIETRVIGRIPKGQSFIPETTGDGTLPNNDQIRYFTQNSSKIVKDFSVPTVLEGIGGAGAGGYSEVNNILGTNVSAPPGSGDQINLNPQDGELKLQTPIPIVPLDGFVQYPKKMRPEQDKIKFTAVKIKPKTLIDEPGLGFRFPGPQYERVGGRVYLAIQAPISDQNSVEWGPDNVNAIQAATFKASYGFIKEGFAGAEGRVKKILDDIYATANVQSERIKRAMAGQAASLNNVLSRTDGAILNPNLELLFQAPQLRPFTFQFKLTARSMDEARDIKTIIKYFKYHMAVRQEKDQLFLRAPHVFTIQYMKGMDPNHPGINMISPTEETKACALTNFSVDYTPLGTYMTYLDNEDNPNDPANGTMVAYTLSLQFQEITPIYDTDYQIEHPIGF